MSFALSDFSDHQLKNVVLPKFNSPIAFAVGLPASFSGGPEDSIIPYDYVYLNHGDGYRLDYEIFSLRHVDTHYLN